METIHVPKKIKEILVESKTLDKEEERKLTMIIRKRIADIEKDSSIGKSEEELKEYLGKRGVNVARMGD